MNSASKLSEVPKNSAGVSSSSYTNLQTVIVDYLVIHPYFIVRTAWKTKGIRFLI